MRLIDADALIEKMVQIPLRQWNTKTFGEALDSIPTVEEDTNVPGKWISVKDRLPEDGVEVLVWDDGGFAYIDTWIGHTWKLGGDFGVTHWMPLPTAPEPPEEVSRDERG